MSSPASVIGLGYGSVAGSTALVLTLGYGNFTGFVPRPPISGNVNLASVANGEGSIRSNNLNRISIRFLSGSTEIEHQ